MGRPAGGYKLADGTKIPGVTTICSRFKDSGGLIYWAWNEGREGRDFRETRDAAADAGKLAHAMIEAWASPWTEPELAKLLHVADEQTRARARMAFSGFERWAAQTKLEIVETEVSLVSERYRYGGTIDALGKLPDGRYVLPDWKSGGGVYPDHIAQIAAYDRLLQECREIRCAEFHCLRIDKEFGSFSHKAWPRDVIEAGWDYFEHIRRAYEHDKILKRAVK